MIGYQAGFASLVSKFFDKNPSSSGIKDQDITKKKFAEKLCKPIIRKFKKQKAYSFFIDDIWGADLADMQLIK